MKKINIAEKSFNPFDLIGQKWMLISAGTEDKWNTMTASWGAVGVMWGKPSATCYIRKSRFTKEFVDAGEYFTLTVLKDGNRQALNTLGSKSGRDMDKMHESGLTGIHRGSADLRGGRAGTHLPQARCDRHRTGRHGSGSAGQVVRRSRLPHHVYRRDRSRLRELISQKIHQFLTVLVYHQERSTGSLCGPVSQSTNPRLKREECNS